MTDMQDWINQYLDGIDLEIRRLKKIPGNFHQERRCWCPVCNRIYIIYGQSKGHPLVDYFEKGHLPKISFKDRRNICPECLDASRFSIKLILPELYQELKIENINRGAKMILYNKIWDLYQQGGINISTKQYFGLRMQIIKQLELI